MLIPTTDFEVHRKTVPPERQDQLSHEAWVLSSVRHPGVVSLAREPDARPQELFLRKVGDNLVGRRLAPEEVAGLGAAVGTTLADLHDLGVVYNGCSLDHILLGSDGAPVLCSFGKAQCGLEDRELADGQRSDVVALVELLAGLVTDDRGGLRRLLRRTGRQRHPSARSLARQLAGFAGARLPTVARPGSGAPPPSTELRLDPLDPIEIDWTTTLPSRHRTLGTGVGASPDLSASTGRRHRRFVSMTARLAGATTLSGRKPGWRTVAAGVAVGLILASTALVIHSNWPHTSATCPGVDAGCRPVATPGGILTTPAGRWWMGETGDVVVLGRWLCGPTALPALLRPRDGEIWVFDSWADSHSEVTARFLTRVPGATSLAVVAEAKSCDRIEVLGPGGHRTTVNPS